MPQEGDYVCVRSRDQGVVWGTLVYVVGRECRLRDARQQHSWGGGKCLTLFDVVMKGPEVAHVKLSETVEEIDMQEICGVILVPKKWIKAFKEHPAS
jgi:hypothetical protein